MDPLLILFGFGVGVLVGMTGMGGGSLMTPLLVLLFGVKPTLAVGTDIAYQAVTKTVGGYKHIKLKTVNFQAVLWLALGSVPGSILGVQVIHQLEVLWGDKVETFTLIALSSVLALVGLFTLIRSVFYPALTGEDNTGHVKLTPGLRAAAIGIGLVTGFVIGITSAGSGTVIAVALIAIFKIRPRFVVGTDVVQGAILLWAAGLAHWAGGSVDFGLMATLLVGSIPGVWIGSNFSVKVPESSLKTALGVVLLLSSSATFRKAGVEFLPGAMLTAAIGFAIAVIFGIRSGRLANPWKDQDELVTEGIHDFELAIGELSESIVEPIENPALHRRPVRSTA
jgi:uncharacterized membrane protein YfcA